MRSKELRSIGALLERFKNLRPPQAAVVDVFCAAAQAACGVPVPKKAVRYTVATRTIGIIAAGPLKSEIALKRGEILAACVRELGAHAPKEIV